MIFRNTRLISFSNRSFIVIALLCVTVQSRDNPKDGGTFKARADETKSQQSGSISQHNAHSYSLKQPTIKIQQSSRDYKSDTANCNQNQGENNCAELDEPCLKCQLNEKCRYGENITIPCETKSGVECKGNKNFQREMVCQYCYQTPLWQQKCSAAKGCNSVGAPRNYYMANCTVSSKVICLGHRNFNRMMPCKWKNGYRWSTTFILSVTLGGFGADRFYLGRWQEGIGKLFSFGGLGVWTIIDIILIGVGYLGPNDGSLYVD